jgi:hypothetical protein
LTNKDKLRLRYRTMKPYTFIPYRLTLVKFFDILEEVKKEEQTTIGDCCVCAHHSNEQSDEWYETS